MFCPKRKSKLSYFSWKRNSHVVKGNNFCKTYLGSKNRAGNSPRQFLNRGFQTWIFRWYWHCQWWYKRRRQSSFWNGHKSETVTILGMSWQRLQTLVLIYPNEALHSLVCLGTKRVTNRLDDWDLPFQLELDRFSDTSFPSSCIANRGFPTGKKTIKISYQIVHETGKGAKHTWIGALVGSPSGHMGITM